MMRGVGRLAVVRWHKRGLVVCVAALRLLFCAGLCFTITAGGFAVSDFVCGLTFSSTAVQAPNMQRRLRIEFEGAIRHVMARGYARQKIVRDDAGR
jgi:hypothetical protein